MLRRVLTVAAVGAALVAFGLVSGDVHGGDGAICGSAWRSANRTLPSEGGERTQAERDESADRCELAGERALRFAALSGVVAAAAGAGSRFAR